MKERTELWNLAGPSAARVTAGRNHHAGKSQSVLADSIHCRVQQQVHGEGRRRGDGISAHHAHRSGVGLHSADRARRRQRQHGRDQGARLAIGQVSVPELACRLHSDHPRASGRQCIDPLRPACRRTIHRRWSEANKQNGEGGGPWKRRCRGPRGKPKSGFPPGPPPLGNPAAGFPLSHRSGEAGINQAEPKTPIRKPQRRSGSNQLTGQIVCE